MAKLLMALLGGMFGAFILNYGGKIEGSLAPVVGPLAISDPVQIGPNQTQWSGSAQKYRGCNFVRMEWFLGPRDGRRVEVASGFIDPPKIRNTGLLEWSGIVISLDINAVTTNSHADVLSDCGWPWLTRSPFYDSEVRK